MNQKRREIEKKIYTEKKDIVVSIRIGKEANKWLKAETTDQGISISKAFIQFIINECVKLPFGE